MEKRSDKWYEERIRRRAAKHELLEHSECVDFSTLDTDDQTIVLKALPVDLVPILILGSLENRWTAFGVRGVFSIFNGQANLVRFGSSKGAPKPAVPTGNGVGKTPKSEAEFLLYGEEVIWTPKGSAFFAVWNLLKSIERSYPSARS